MASSFSFSGQFGPPSSDPRSDAFTGSNVGPQLRKLEMEAKDSRLDPTSSLEAQRRLNKALGSFNRIVDSNAADLDKLAEAYESLNKEFERSRGGDRVAMFKLKQQALQKLLKEIGDKSGELVQKIAAGGLSKEELQGLLTALKIQTDVAGEGSEAAIKKQQELLKEIQLISEKGRSDLTGAMLAAKELMSGFSDTMDSMQQMMAEQRQSIAEDSQELIRARARQAAYEARGQHWRARLVGMTRAAGGGGLPAELLAAGGRSAALRTLTGGASSALSNFVQVGASGVPHIAIAKIIAKALKTGFDQWQENRRIAADTYMNARMYGSSGNTRLDDYSQTRKDYNDIAMASGVGRDDLLRLRSQANKVLQRGTAGYSGKNTVEYEKQLTRLLLQVGATGIESDTAISIAGKAQSNLGANGALALANVPKQAALSIEQMKKDLGAGSPLVANLNDFSELFSTIAGDVANSGLSMEKLRSNVTASWVAATRLNSTLDGTRRMTQQIEDIRSGKAGAEAGQSMELLLASGADFRGITGSTSNAIQAMVGNALDARKPGNSMAKVRQVIDSIKARGGEGNDKLAEQLRNQVYSDADACKVLTALADPTSNQLLSVAAQIGGVKTIQVLQKLTQIDGIEALLGPNYKTLLKNAQRKILELSDEQLSAMGISGAGLAQLTGFIESSPRATNQEESSKANKQIADSVKEGEKARKHSMGWKKQFGIMWDSTLSSWGDFFGDSFSPYGIEKFVWRETQRSWKRLTGDSGKTQDVNGLKVGTILDPNAVDSQGNIRLTIEIPAASINKSQVNSQGNTPQ